MNTNDQALLAKIADILVKHVEPIFKDEVKITLIVRLPGNNDADVVVSSDDINELTALIERGKAREVVVMP